MAAYIFMEVCRLCTLGVYELDRHSQPSKRVCHYWKLHEDQLFAFWRRFATASIFSTWQSTGTWLVFSCVRPSWNENQH